MRSGGLAAEILNPGETVILAGKRGGGKTATALSIAQHALQGDYGHENVRVITNILFGRVIKGRQPVEDYPPGVIHEDTLAGTMRRIGEIIREYGSGNCLILWILDEAQNFMIADQNMGKENQMLVKYLGNARKFDACNFFLTPSINNLAPRVRSFGTGDAKSGYCSCQMQKDPAEARKLAGGDLDPRSITFFRTATDGPWEPVVIRPTSWIRGIYGSGLPDGSYGYDTKSMATFSIGKNDDGVPFNLERFLEVTSKGLSHELPRKIDEYFDSWESEGSDADELPGEDYGRIHISDQCRRISRARDMGLTWRQIASIEGEAMTTIQSRFYKFMGEPASSKTDIASVLTNDETRGRTGPYIYNPIEERGERGVGSSEEGVGTP